MKYVSLDIETTGLNPDTDQVLQLGAIIEDTTRKLPREECPTFEAYQYLENYSGNPFALAMNGEIFKKIVELKKQGSPKLMRAADISLAFALFLHSNGIDKAVIAGKNAAGFDIPFLKKLTGFENIKMHHRVLDAGMLFLDFSKDAVLPDLKECKVRAGLNGGVAHDALDDAWDVIELFRTKY